MNNKKPGIKEGWKRVPLFIVTYVLCSLVAGILLNSIPQLNSDLYTYLLILITGIISIVLVQLFGYRFIKKSSLTESNDQKVATLSSTARDRLRDSATGIFLSIGLVGSGSFLLFLTGLLQWSINNIDIAELLLTALLMVWIAFYEELVFRGFILENLLGSFKKPIALLISAAVFALFHAFNPGMSILAILNIFTGGILIGLTYMHNRNLWFPICFHFGWNYIQGPVLGFQVSGIQLPSILKANLSGSEWLNGGDFGFEGSVIQLLVVLLGIIILLSSHKQN